MNRTSDQSSVTGNQYRLRRKAIGRTAVRTLLEMRMKNELARPFMITPHHLTERESTRKNAVEETA